MGESVVNDFQADLEWSHDQSDSPMWEQVYRAAFPGFSGMQAVKKDGWAQRAGIDRKVFLADGTDIKIDEKARRKVWPDIALEWWSNVERETPGWMNKPMACDFIAYAFIPSQTCYLLPYHALRLAWWRNREDWYTRYRHIRAPNPKGGYMTLSIGVPIDVLLESLKDAMIIHWGAAA